jgi:hypothetical protein
MDAVAMRGNGCKGKHSNGTKSIGIKVIVTQLDIG